MLLKASWGVLLILTVSGCNSSSTPPGTKNPNEKNKEPEYPPNAIVVGTRYAVPPEEWGQGESVAGIKAYKIKGDEGTIGIDIFTASGLPSRLTADQVARFKSMIKPASAVNADEFQVQDLTISRVTGAGTRLTFRGLDAQEIGSRYENEGLIGVVFGKHNAELLIMVSGKAKEVKAFAPKLENWLKSFK
jgi:hypothetical protein